jgi:hypothetical protein
MGAIYNGLGEKNEAFKWFYKAYEERSSLLIHLRMEPEFDNLHTDPRYKDLMNRLGFSV